jgi:hypothetical protein
VTPSSPTLLALLREIAAAEADGSEYRVSGGLPEICALANAGLVFGSRPKGRRMAWVVTDAGREVLEECGCE